VKGDILVETKPGRKYLVCFDLDGTLLDSLLGIAQASNRALEKLGFPAKPVEKYRSYVGYGPDYLSASSLPEVHTRQDQDNWGRYYQKYYAESNAACTVPYPGVPQMLERIKESGVWLAVLTNKFHNLAVEQVARYFPGMFDHVMGYVKGVPVKPNPYVLEILMNECGVAPEQTVYVGDLEVDIETALACGARPVGVLWGFGGTGLRSGLKEVDLVETPEELVDLLLG